MPVQTYIDSYPGNVMHILKNSKLYLGYQSGLNIMADNMDVKQVIMYYSMLEKMKYTWCKKENIGKTFYADMFSSPPREVAKHMTLEL